MRRVDYWTFVSMYPYVDLDIIIMDMDKHRYYFNVP